MNDGNQFSDEARQTLWRCIRSVVTPETRALMPVERPQAGNPDLDEAGWEILEAAYLLGQASIESQLVKATLELQREKSLTESLEQIIKATVSARGAA